MEDVHSSGAHIRFEEGSLSIYRQLVQTITVDDDDEEDSEVNDDEDWDNDDWSDERSSSTYIYGPVEKVTFSMTHLNPNYDREMKAYQDALARWESKTKSRRERAEKIKVVERENKEKIHLAHTNHRDLWIAAGKELKLEGNTDLLEVKRDALRRELEMIEAQLSAKDSENNQEE